MIIFPNPLNQSEKTTCPEATDFTFDPSLTFINKPFHLVPVSDLLALYLYITLPFTGSFSFFLSLAKFTL